MKLANLMGHSNQSRLLLTSIILAVSITAKAQEEHDADYHYNLAIEAYNENRCLPAVEHFTHYLNLAEVKEEKKVSIETAIAWCYEYERVSKKYANFRGIMAPREKVELYRKKPSADAYP